MEYFEQKVVPSFRETEGLVTQEEFCDNSKCEEESVDCGDCIFSCTFCKDSDLFHRWLEKHKKEKEEEDEQ